MLRALCARLITCGLLAVAVSAPARVLAQDDVPLPPPQVVVPTDPPTFKTSRSLVTVDCVVVDKEGKQVTDLALLRDGRLLYRSPETAGAPATVTAPRGHDLRAIPIAGLLSLGADVPPGAYTLQVIATAGKKKVAVGFGDFAVRR